MFRAARVLIAFCYLITGCLGGVLALDFILRANSTLLLRGMALPAPVDPPLTVLSYDVHYSDADEFTWRPDLIRPVSPAFDRLEARVTYETDENGFRNQGPLPARVDAVVLGRSISLAAHLAQPWPMLAAQQLNWQVLNLSQPGSGIEVKSAYLKRFGLPRQPRWVIIEAVPSIDMIGRYQPAPLVSQELLFPVIQTLARRWMAKVPQSSTRAIYPLNIDLPGRKFGLTCCIHYLEFFSLDRQSLEASSDWASYREELLKLVETARLNRACVALLYAPTKPDIYFPLAEHPEELQPALRDGLPLGLNPQHRLEVDDRGSITVSDIRRNALAGHDLLADFARQNHLLWIDPNQDMAQSVRDGHDPFMMYDSHWNQLGHQIVAQNVSQALIKAPCP